MRRQIFRAFTLIEVLIVLIMIGIILTVFLPGYYQTYHRARDVGRTADVTKIWSSFMMYFDDYTRYPLSGGCVDETLTWYTDYASYIPTDPNPMHETLGCVGTYRFLPLERAWVPGWAVLVLSRVESKGFANFMLDLYPITYEEAQSNFCGQMHTGSCASFDGNYYYAVLQ
jgi:prepilin-type N-terminal cleavage/methylation domain-containing protein